MALAAQEASVALLTGGSPRAGTKPRHSGLDGDQDGRGMSIHQQSHSDSQTSCYSALLAIHVLGIQPRLGLDLGVSIGVIPARQARPQCPGDASRALDAWAGSGQIGICASRLHSNTPIPLLLPRLFLPFLINYCWVLTNITKVLSSSVVAGVGGRGGEWMNKYMHT